MCRNRGGPGGVSYWLPHWPFVPESCDFSLTRSALPQHHYSVQYISSASVNIGERSLLTRIKAKCSLLLDPAIQQCSLLEARIFSSGGPDLFRSFGKSIVSHSELHIRALEGPDIDSEDDYIDVSSPSIATSHLFQRWRFTQTTGETVLLLQTQFGLKDYNGDHAQSYTSLISTMQSDNKEIFRWKSLEQHNASVRSRQTHLRSSSQTDCCTCHLRYSSFWDVVLGIYLVGHHMHLRNIGKNADRLSDFTYGFRY